MVWLSQDFNLWLPTLEGDVFCKADRQKKKRGRQKGQEKG